MNRVLGLFQSRGTLVIAFLGALLAIAVVLQAAESMWHTVSPPEEYTPPPPTTDPEEILDVPAIPPLPELSAQQHAHDQGYASKRSRSSGGRTGQASLGRRKSLYLIEAIRS